MGDSKALKIIGPLMVISGVVLVIFGIVYISLSFSVGPNIGMAFDEFSAAMQLSSTYSFTGIALLGGGSFLILPGFCVSVYGGGFSGGGRLSVKRTSNLYRNANPYLKGGVVKNKEKCPYCQAEIQEGLKICSDCGSEL